MQHLRLFENFDNINETQDKKAAVILGYQTMQSLMLSDKDRSGRLYKTRRSELKWDRGQVSELYSDSDYRIFYLNWSVGLDKLPKSLEGKMGEVEGYVFMKMQDNHYYLGFAEFLGDQDGNIVIQADGYNDLYRDIDAFNEKWTDTLESGKINAEEAKGMYDDVAAMFNNRSEYDKETVEVGEQLPELG